MAKIDVVNLEGKKVGALDLADAVFGAEVKEHLLYEVVKAQLASRRAGTARRPRSARRGPRRRQEALQAEGHRPRAPGLDPRAALRRRRQGASARSRATTRTGRRARCASARSRARSRCAPRRGRSSSSTSFELAEIKTKALAGVARRRSRPPRRRWSSTRRRTTTSSQSVRNLAGPPVPAARGRQRLRPPPPRHAGPHARTRSRQLEARCSRRRGVAMRDAQTIIKRPLLTEKGTRLRETGGARVARATSTPAGRLRGRAATRTRSRSSDAVQKLFNVDVVDVRHARSCAARRSAWAAATRQAARTGRRRSSPSQQGETIEFFERSLRAMGHQDHTSRPRPARRDYVASATSPSSRKATSPRRRSLEHQTRDRRPQQPRPHHLRFRGGGHKQRYRIIDFKRNKIGVPAHGRDDRVRSEPHRAHRAPPLRRRREALHPRARRPRGRRHGASSAATPTSSRATACRCASSRSAPTIHNVELKIGKGGAARAARPASRAQLMAKEGDWAPGPPALAARSARSTSTAAPPSARSATSSTRTSSIGKAGRTRWLGRRPHNRGVTMNPVDHPMGGGEGRTSGGRHPCSPWGQLVQGPQDPQQQAHRRHDRQASRARRVDKPCLVQSRKARSSTTT